MLDTSTLTMISSQNKERALSIITGIRFNAGLLKAYNSITFLFDPNWSYDTEAPNFPLAFFMVKKMTELSESEVSHKPLLFYNASIGGGDTTKAGLMNIVADNVIIKPKSYKLDVIIPMSVEGVFTGAYWNPETIMRVEKTLLTGNGKEDSVLSTFFRTTDSVLGIFKTLIKTLYGTTLSASSIMTMITSQQDYNKNSIDYMWKSRRFVRLKLWTGWKFKDLIITNFECTKSGEDGDYFEGSIVCQEVPILTFRDNTKLKAVSDTLAGAIGKAMCTVTTKFINAMEASAGEI